MAETKNIKIYVRSALVGEVKLGTNQTVGDLKISIANILGKGPGEFVLESPVLRGRPDSYLLEDVLVGHNNVLDRVHVVVPPSPQPGGGKRRRRKSTRKKRRSTRKKRKSKRKTKTRRR